MKLFKGACLAGTVYSRGITIDAPCDVSELTIPENAIGWDCDDSVIGDNGQIVENTVPARTKCWLKCEPGYIDYICERI